MSKNAQREKSAKAQAFVDVVKDNPRRRSFASKTAGAVYHRFFHGFTQLMQMKANQK